MSLNKAMLIGRLGKDPETRYTKSGAQVTEFSIATDESYKDKSGVVQKSTEWHNVVAWGKVAAFVAEYLKKGREVYVEGSIKTESWEKDGVKRYATKITAQVVRFVGPRPDGQMGPSEQGHQQGGDDVMEDDIPF